MKSFYFKLKDKNDVITSRTNVTELNRAIMESSGVEYNRKSCFGGFFCKKKGEL